jgi:hypothetical protein
MVESPTSECARQSLGSGKASDVLAVYERLLAVYVGQLQGDEFNPYQSLPRLVWRCFNSAFQMRFRKHAAAFLRTSNTLPQDLAGGSVVLRELETLDDKMLRGVAECNRINLRRLLRRSVLGWAPKLAAGAGVLIALPRALKDIFGVDVLAALSSEVASILTPVAVSAFIGFVLGSIVNLALSMPKLGFLRAIDDLIAIAVAHRGVPRKE